MLPWSDEARAMVRPVRTYEELGERPDDELAPIGERVVRILLLLGAFVALSTAGRLVPFHVASTFVAWAFVPILQSLAVVVAVLAVDRERKRIRRALSLYFAGHGPWLFFLLLVAAACILAPSPGDLARRALSVGLLPLLLVAVFVWGVVLTSAAFVVGLDLGRSRGALATLVFYATWLSSLAIWYVAMGEAQTLFRAV